MRVALHPSLLALAAVSALVFGCAETKTKVTRVDLKVNLKACLGDADGNVQIGSQNIKSTCRDELASRIPDLPVNACLILVDAQAEGTPAYYVPLKWKDGTLTPSDPSKLDLDLAVGHKIRSEFYFFGEGATAELCGGANSIPPGTEQPGEYKCKAEQFCLFKLVQTDVNFSEGGTIDFKGKDGACNSVWRPDLEGTLEVCDGQDNDCDGAKDDSIQDAEGHKIGEACTLGLGDCEANGRYVCKDGGVQCNAVPKRPGVERCDGRDNDCNGIDDDGNVADCCARDPADPTQGERGACGAGVGVCVVGERQCQIAEGEARGVWGPCLDPATAMPVITVGAQVEVCDNLDNDCNGTVNDGFDVGATCEAGLGACLTQGTKVCTADGTATMCSAVPGQGGNEVCDGLDNNCDGTTDEGFPLGEPCSEGTGACAVTGVNRCDPANVMGTICADGAGRAVVPGAATQELCGDDVDSDCDGNTSNGYEAIGAPCAAGLGLCRRDGNNVCDPVARLSVVCGAQVGAPVPELCDLQDNDCDGETDETFDTTSDPANCGGCNHPCELAHAVPACQAGQCQILGCLDQFEDYDHLIENGCECNRGEADEPDPEYLDTNCDDVDGDRNLAIFVSAAAGHDPNEANPGTGTIDNPYRSLPAAVAVAANQLNRPILLDAGEYALDETLTIPAGVQIHGGYRYNQALTEWSRAGRNVNETRITGTNIVLRYRDLNRATLLDNVVVVATNAQPATHASIGLHVINAGDHLTLRDTEIRAGQGGPGRPGSNGSALVGAVAGSIGAAANAGRPGVGGAGGTNPRCLGDSTGGGEGGDGARSADGNVASTAGAAGQGADAVNGVGGPGGPDDRPGEDGLGGRPGANGGNSGPANSEGMVLDLNVNGVVIPLIWQPRQSQAAMNGTAGTGGGGGGGGGGAAGVVNSKGGGGGGGGAGGCGGQGGDGAYGGGGSFGIFLVGGHITMVNSRVLGGTGGDGGEGGDGAPGEAGASGGAGGLRAPDCAACGLGGNGGDGGQGGCGGHAGGGAGGPSFAVFRVAPPGRDEAGALFTVAESTVDFADYDGTALDFEMLAGVSLVTGQAGRGGQGGSRVSCGDAAASGAEGAAGPIGCCRRSGAAGATCGELGACE